MRRVVVTGIGALTPIGNTAEEFWNNLIAGKSGSAPITYFIMNQWLEGFAFRIGWSPYYFAIGLVMIAITVISTIIFKVIYAARSNPTQTLRGE